MNPEAARQRRSASFMRIMTPCRLGAGLLALGVAMLLLWRVPCGFAGEADESQKVFRFVMSQSVLDDTDPRDVKIAMDLWARELSRSLEVKNYSVRIAGNLEDTLEILKKGDLDLIALSAIDYLKLEDLTKTVPLLLGANNAGKSREHLLLVRSDSGIKTLKQLRGKTIMILSEKRNSLSSIWLDVLLMRRGVWERDAFFARVTDASSYSQSVMSVFFKKADAAIVTRGAYETANALNPQISRRLRIIEKSRDLIGNISCVLPSTSKKYRDMIEDVGMRLHESPTGRQVLTLFKLDRIIRFQPGYLTGLKELLQERDRLRAQKTRKKSRVSR